MSNILQSISDSLAEIVEKAGRSIVRVEARRSIPATGVVWSQEGIIVTANHAVKRDERISVGLAEGESLAATLVGRDPTTDLAVLRIDQANLAPLQVPDSFAVKVGHLALALARPGRTVQATLGILNAVGKSWRTALGGAIDAYLQSDAEMFPGFSGGPLIDTAGNWLGVNSSALARHANVTIPGSTIKRVVGEILAHGRVRRGFLGIGAQAVALPAALQQQLNQESALLIVSVAAGSNAERAGLLLGDAIVAVDDQAIKHLEHLSSLLTADRIGQEVTLRIVRAGLVNELKVQIGENS